MKAIFFVPEPSFIHKFWFIYLFIYLFCTGFEIGSPVTWGGLELRDQLASAGIKARWCVLFVETYDEFAFMKDDRDQGIQD